MDMYTNVLSIHPPNGGQNKTSFKLYIEIFPHHLMHYLITFNLNYLWRTSITFKIKKAPLSLTTTYLFLQCAQPLHIHINIWFSHSGEYLTCLNMTLFSAIPNCVIFSIICNSKSLSYLTCNHHFMQGFYRITKFGLG